MKRFWVLLGQLEHRGREHTWVAGVLFDASSIAMCLWCYIYWISRKWAKRCRTFWTSLRCRSCPRTLPSRISRGARSESKLHRQSLFRGLQGTLLASTPSSSRSMTDWRSRLRLRRTAHPPNVAHHSPSPQSWENGWGCLDLLGLCDGDIAKVKKAWLSLLCPAQYLMIDKDVENGKPWSSGSSVLVVARSAWQGIDGLIQRVRLLPTTTSVQKAGSAHTPPLGLLLSATNANLNHSSRSPRSRGSSRWRFCIFRAHERFGLRRQLQKNNPLKSKCSTASSRRRSLVFVRRHCWLLWRSVTSRSWTSTTASLLCKRTFRQWRTFLSTRTFRTSEKVPGQLHVRCPPKKRLRKRAHLQRRRPPRRQWWPRKWYGNCGPSPKTPIGTSPRHASACPNAKGASWPKTWTGSASWPQNIQILWASAWWRRHGRGRGAKDKVVLPADAGVCSADRVAMAYKSEGGAMSIWLDASSTRGKFAASSKAAFFRGSVPTLVIYLDGGTEAKIAHLTIFKCFDRGETVAAQRNSSGKKMWSRHVDGQKTRHGFVSFPSPSPTINHWAPLSLNFHHHHRDNIFISVLANVPSRDEWIVDATGVWLTLLLPWYDGRNVFGCWRWLFSSPMRKLSTTWRTSCCARFRIMLAVRSCKDSDTKKNWVRWLWHVSSLLDVVFSCQGWTPEPLKMTYFSTVLSCQVCWGWQGEVGCLGFGIAVICVVHCCSGLSLSPNKDGLQQYGEGCDGRHLRASWNTFQFVEGFQLCVFFVRGRGFSPETSAWQKLHPESRQSSTGSVVINAMLPGRHCLEAPIKNKANAPSGSQHVPSHQCFAQFQNVAVPGRTTHVPRDGPFGSIGIRSSTGCTCSRKLGIAVLLEIQFLWPTMRERGFARWSETQCHTLAVMDVSEEPWSAMLYLVSSCVVCCSAAQLQLGIARMLPEQLHQRKEKLCASATAHGVVCVVCGLFRRKIVDRLHLIWTLSIAVPFAMRFLWPTVNERGFAKWSDIQYPTPAVMDISAAPCLRCSLLVSMVCETFLCLLFYDSLLQKIPNAFCVWAGGRARGDVQDVSTHSFFEWVCRSVLARSVSILSISCSPACAVRTLCVTFLNSGAQSRW